MTGIDQLAYGFNWGIGAAGAICLFALVVMLGYITADWLISKWRG